MNLKTEATQTGKNTKAQDLKVGDRVLFGMSTRTIRTATTTGGVTYLTYLLDSGQVAYRTYRSTRTFRTF